MNNQPLLTETRRFMWKQSDQYVDVENLFLAGHRVPAGTYKQIGGDREVKLDHEDFLPASLDGRVASYMRVNPPREVQLDAERVAE